MTVNIFIQARMSSKRFPGKILAPFKGQPLIYHLIEACKAMPLVHKTVVLTSDQPSDDPLVSYLKDLNVDFFRGNLENVFQRFQQALGHYACSQFVRLCADSPLIQPLLIKKLIELSDDSVDLTTNVYKRTFPKGMSVEVIKSKIFLETQEGEVDQADKEHVTSHFYHYPEKYKIRSVESVGIQTQEDMCVDTLNDLHRLSDENFVFNTNALTVRLI